MCIWLRSTRCVNVLMDHDAYAAALATYEPRVVSYGIEVEFEGCTVSRYSKQLPK